MRCAKCQQITSEFALSEEWGKRVVVFDDLASIDRSAQRGCDFCAMLFRHLVKRVPKHHGGPYQLSNYRGWLGLNGQGYSDSFEWCVGECKKTWYSKDENPVQRIAPDSILNGLAFLAEERIKPWLRKCHQSHKHCKYEAVQPPKLPTRVIDVGDQNQSPHLHVTAEDGENNAGYLTLSYCWGAGNNSAKTTRANFNNRRREINYAELPKTVRDAIDITRALGERFLWVDAVCIIQPDGDDDEDWKSQAPLMWQYYRDSLVTIAASMAPDSSVGFIHERLFERYQVKKCDLEPWEDPKQTVSGPRSVHVHIESNPPLTNGNHFYWATMGFSPLSKRAWAFQEYELSSRILHWTQHELMWECAEMRASERTPDGVTRKTLGSRQSHMKLDSKLSLPKNSVLGSHWFSLVERYSDLSLTHESDRLIALDGIAARAKECFNDRYLFGLWKSSLPEGLAWEAAHLRLPGAAKSCYAPSWSWAACRGGGVKYPSDEVMCDWMLEVIRIDGETDFTRPIARQCGLVVKGTLEKLGINARRPVRSPNAANANVVLEKAEFMRILEEDVSRFSFSHDLRVVFDSPDQIPEHVRSLDSLGSLDCLRLGIEEEVADDGRVDRSAIYLVLKQVDEKCEKYRRIGIMRDHRQKWSESDGEPPRSIITII